MRRMRSLQLDVFTSEPFHGNQLAVFFDADQITPEEMQAVAREMNFSECVFVLSATDPAALTRLRIFTPKVELPFAGHPVIGATFALAATGRISSDTTSPMLLETGVGLMPIELLFADARLSFAWMRQPIPAFEPWNGDRETLAASLGLAASDLSADLPIEHGSAGVPFLFIPLASADALDRARSGPDLPAALAPADPRTGAYLFTPPSVSGASRVNARMFAQEFGVIEDPATGSAAGPCGAYLVRHQLVPLEDDRAYISITQGEHMGRPSRLRVTIERREDAITEVRVGGEAVVVARGEFLLPDGLTAAD